LEVVIGLYAVLRQEKVDLVGLLFILIAQIPLGSSRLDTTRLDTFDVSSPCILAVSSLSNSTARHDERDRHDSQLSYDHRNLFIV